MNEPELKLGRIYKALGGFYYVDIGDSSVVCRARGKFRKLKITPLVGDMVKISVQQDGAGYLMELAPRKNQLIRPPAVNLDMVVIIASQAPPVTDPYLIDRVLSVAEYQGISACIVVNKCDINEGGDLQEMYLRAGYPVFSVSGYTGAGITGLREHLEGKFSVFTGNSGVGKSTILNQIAPEAGLETGEINERIGRGRHTTRHVEMIKVSESVWIADTPGFSAFDASLMGAIKKEELAYTFLEFLPYLDGCRFTGCSHIKDAGCAVQEAVQSGKIMRSRHDSYVRMYEEMKSCNAWEQKRDV